MTQSLYKHDQAMTIKNVVLIRWYFILLFKIMKELLLDVCLYKSVGIKTLHHDFPSVQVKWWTEPVSMAVMWDISMSWRI